MTLTCEVLNPLQSSRWDELAWSAPGYTFFHSSSWARVLHDSYGYEPVYLAFFRDGECVALVPFMTINSLLTPRRGVSLPFTDHCEPLLLQDGVGPELMEQLVEYASQAGWKSMELRGDGGLFSETPKSCTFYRHQLDLSVGEAGLKAQMRHSTRSNFRKAARMGVEVSVSTTGEALEQFYHLNCQTRQRHGLPPQPYSFFRNVRTHIIDQGKGIIVLAHYRGRAISGGVYFHQGDQALYKYGASDLAYQELRANNLVMWEAIRWYLQRHATSLCFGRTEPDNQGLLQFKNGWGAREDEIAYYRFDLRQKSFVQGGPSLKGWQSSICQRLPLPVLKLAGAILYKSAG